MAYTVSMSRDLWLAIRQALLMIVDAIEKELGLKRTSALRRLAKQ